MPRLALLFVLASSVTLGACTNYGSISDERIGSAQLKFANGLPAGTVQISGSGDTVRLSAALAGFEEGPKGFHLHMTGQCVAPDFASAGGHLNPAGSEHGTDNPNGAHMGDLPNAEISSRGTATISTVLRGSRAEIVNALFDQDGSAVVVHAGPDDYKSDPTGNAGGRVACGVIKRS